ncbi:Crossover junction endonuclease mus81 [Ceratobasidium sp. 428]|nr:Crossover junction endonuclease mus81 [Ceratobasidium sp. 428]
MPPKRIKCLNPVFTTWLEEMRDEVDPDSKQQNVYNRAIKSMRAHERYIEHPVSHAILRHVLYTHRLVNWKKDCAEVKYVGPRLRDQLIKRYNESQGIVSTQPQGPIKSLAPRVARVGSRPKPRKNQVHSDVEHLSPNESDSSSRSRQSPVSGTLPSALSIPVPITTAIKRGSKTRKTVASGTLSDSEPEPDLMDIRTPIKAPRTILTSQLAPTPRSLKRTRSVPDRPRLSDFIPAPAATSDIEPDKSNLDLEDDTALSSFEPIIFPAGTYTIQLILDEREVKSTKNRDYILKGLQKRGVCAEKRALEIGDVCWVARSKDPVDESQAECILDYIVERKRMDDLKSSIFDGRFHEQKEDYDTERITQHWKDQINTALSSTQVIDRFFLKETTSIEDTLDYLSGLHKIILTLHKGKALHIIPSQLIKRHSFLKLKEDLDSKDSDRIYHTTYKSYQVLNRKNGFYSLQDNMARILQCIRGLSEEKISALIEHYPTPRSLYQAFKEAEERHSTREDLVSGETSGKGKGKAEIGTAPKNLLVELGGQGRRKIGPALSKHIYEIFMSHSYES